MGRVRIDIVHRNDSWKVTSAGRVLSTHETKDEAIAEGVRVANNNRPSQLVIHRLDGTIEDERTYGDDPFPPRG